MKQWVKDSNFERLGIFTYSHEENTHAYKLVDDVPDEVKQERAAEIMEIQAQISLKHNQQKIGKTFGSCAAFRKRPKYTWQRKN